MTRFIPCPPLVFGIRGVLTPENYISQVPLLTGFLLDLANGKLWWELEAGGREKSGDFSPCVFAIGSGLVVPSLGPAPLTPFALPPCSFFFFFFFFLVTTHGMWDLSSPMRDGTCTPCSGSAES